MPGLTGEVHMEPVLKQSIFRSLTISLVVSVAIYILAFGFFTTHEEVNVPTTAAFPLAVWSFPVVFVISLLFFAVKGAGARKP
jgi:predicted ABC-type exoprotein transport system permease subunit